MGLLDDAIREHLDLKRRRGADPAEIERAEREALGPVRRTQDEPEQDGLDHDLEHEEGAAYDHEADEADEADEPVEGAWHEVDTEWDEAFDEPGVNPAGAGVGHPEPPAEERLPEDGDHEEAEGALAAEPGSEPAAPPPPHAAPASGPGERVGEETAEYEVEFDEEAPEGGDDVLQETPEFLQDTPDHDRLWFEQRPPRDFDFDD